MLDGERGEPGIGHPSAPRIGLSAQSLDDAPVAVAGFDQPAIGRVGQTVAECEGFVERTRDIEDTVPLSFAVPRRSRRLRPKLQCSKFSISTRILFCHPAHFSSGTPAKTGKTIRGPQRRAPPNQLFCACFCKNFGGDNMISDNVLGLSQLSRLEANVQQVFSIFRSSCQAFHKYETLRHMSDSQLADLGLKRSEICDALFADLYGHDKSGGARAVRDTWLD